MNVLEIVPASALIVLMLMGVYDGLAGCWDGRGCVAEDDVDEDDGVMWSLMLMKMVTMMVVAWMVMIDVLSGDYR